MDLPNEVLAFIASMTNNIQSLNAVNKRLRSICLSMITDFTIPLTIVQSSSCLTHMYSLKKLHLIGTYELKVQDLTPLVAIAGNGTFSNLTELKLCGIQYKEDLLVDILKDVPNLHTLNILNYCTKMTPLFVMELLLSNKHIKFIAGSIMFKDKTEERWWAGLVNTLVFKITFGHAVIEALPFNKLMYNRYAYSYPFPTGLQ